MGNAAGANMRRSPVPATSGRPVSVLIPTRQLMCAKTYIPGRSWGRRSLHQRVVGAWRRRTAASSYIYAQIHP
jgi:hypothetical protein